MDGRKREIIIRLFVEKFMIPQKHGVFSVKIYFYSFGKIK